MSKSIDEQIRKKVIQCFAEENMTDEMQESGDIEYFDISAVIDKITALIQQEVEETLQRIKKEMEMHTVPEGANLITRSYLNNTIDFEIAKLKNTNHVAYVKNGTSRCSCEIGKDHDK